MWRMASVLPRNLFCRNTSNSSSGYRNEAPQGVSGDPVNNNLSRESSPMRNLDEDRPNKRAHFRDETALLTPELKDDDNMTLKMN